MLNMDQPAEPLGGDNNTPAHPAAGRQAAIDRLELPDKLRVHALAKLLGSRSRDVMAALSDLGEVVRSAQSSISREVAVRVAAELLSDDAAAPAAPDKPPAPSPIAAVSTETVDTSAATQPKPEPAAASAQPVFAAPTALFLPPQPGAAVPAAPKDEKPSPAEDTTHTGPEGAADDGDSDDDDPGSRRRRRRGRRGRGRGKGGQGGDDGEDGAESAEADTEQARKPSGKSSKRRRGGANSEQDTEDAEDEKAGSTEVEAEAESDEDGGGSRRRRRRRRRKGGADDESGGREDDPPNTVVHVRDTRDKPDQPAPSSDDEVRSVKGSTRLEAKRQRRRDGREAGRRRVPVLSEAEFLARREAVDRAMIVRENGDRTQIAVLEDGVLVEHFVTSQGTGSIVGNVYLGAVQNVLPSMEAAFVDIGRGRNAVLYAGEVDWDAAGLEGKARKIEQALSTGNRVLVQVTKDPIGHKGARLTTQISLPGRFLVYVPGGGATGISRKLPDTERKRLKEILKRIVPDDAGVIIRTASEGVSEEELARDVRRLQAQWEVIKEKADAAKAGSKSKSPELLYEEPDLLIKVVRDLFTEDFSNLIVQGGQAAETIEAYVTHVAPDLVDRLKRHVGNNDVFSEHRVDEQILKALDRKVWLPSGGYLVIDRTEAMTVIDVNTGKFTGSGGNLEETVTRNNLESAEEIVRQLRLRDIGGIIVIDFIDMVLESNRDLVLRRLTECLGRDRTRHQVAEVTSLGLVQMTRKRVGTGLIEAYSTNCEHCRGRGLIVTTEPVSHQPNGASTGNGGSNGAQHNGGQNKPGDRRGRGRSGRSDGDVPAKSEPAKPEQARHDAPKPEQAAVEPAAVEQAQPEQAVTQHVQPEQVQPEAAQVEQANVEQAHVEQAPVEQAPVDQGRSEHGQSEPQRVERADSGSTQQREQSAAVRAESSDSARSRTRHRRSSGRPSGPPKPDLAPVVAADPVNGHDRRNETASAEAVQHQQLNGYVPAETPERSTEPSPAASGDAGSSTDAALPDQQSAPSQPTTPPVRRRRRAASRPAGPPVSINE